MNILIKLEACPVCPYMYVIFTSSELYLRPCLASEPTVPVPCCLLDTVLMFPSGTVYPGCKGALGQRLGASLRQSRTLCRLLVGPIPRIVFSAQSTHPTPTTTTGLSLTLSPSGPSSTCAPSPCGWHTITHDKWVYGASHLEGTSLGYLYGECSVSLREFKEEIVFTTPFLPHSKETSRQAITSAVLCVPRMPK